MFKSVSYYDKIADDFLRESKKVFSKAIISEGLRATKLRKGDEIDEFDIFLSHSFLDQKTILGIYKDFEKLGYKTYVDWIIDPTLDRKNITKTTAKKIKERMNQSKCLIYTTSSNATVSKWMPWELGYMDGLKNGKVAVFPLKEDEEDDEDIEIPKYLELYYSCSKEPEEKTLKEILWINENIKTYVSFDAWMDGDVKPYKRN